MLELYYFPTATCGYKARLTLDEAGRLYGPCSTAMQETCSRPNIFA